MTEWTFILRVLLAAGLSAAIGIEREFHGRPAGLRTHLLVGVGAALVIVAFHAAWAAFVGGDPASNGLPAEIGRVAAGVITGIGFLGAGTIIKVGDWVRGLTTAASLWFVATLGIASGLGAFWIAIGGEGLVTLTFRIRHRGTPDLQRLAEKAAGIEGVVETQIRL